MFLKILSDSADKGESDKESSITLNFKIHSTRRKTTLISFRPLDPFIQ